MAKLQPRTFDTVMTVVAVLTLLAAVPWALLDTIENGRLYLFSQQFFDELPQRLTGPGKFRFILQPLVAILLGIRGGQLDAQSARPPFIIGMFGDRDHRRESIRSGISAIRNLVAMGIILDAISQLMIYGEVHPGAALVVGPVLICIPYALSRALTNRIASLIAPG